MNTRQVHTVFLWNKTKYALGKRVWELVDWPCIMCVCVCVCVCVCIIIVNVWGSFRYQMAILSIGRRLFIASENRKGACSHGAAACALSLFYVCPIYIYILTRQHEWRATLYSPCSVPCSVVYGRWSVLGQWYAIHTHTHTHMSMLSCVVDDLFILAHAQRLMVCNTHTNTHTHMCVCMDLKSQG